jgi:hypothetical protein
LLTLTMGKTYTWDFETRTFHELIGETSYGDVLYTFSP